MKTSQNLVRVIMDPKDANKDQWIDKVKAKALYDGGLLSWDITNECYCYNGK